MGKIALNSHHTHDLASIAKDAAGRLSAEVLASLARALSQRRDEPPLDRWSAAEVAANYDFKPTDFGMEAGEVRLQVMSCHLITGRLIGRKKRIYWVFAGLREEDSLFPISCHESLALAAETLMVAYSECCRL